MQERYERLVALQEQISWEENRRLEGRSVEVLVAEGEGRKDAATARVSGRARGQPAGALRAARGPPDADRPAPGDLVTVAVTYGAPHHLVADAALDGGPFAVRRTRAGDAWQRRQAAAEQTGRRRARASSLGMPALRRA